MMSATDRAARAQRRHHPAVPPIVPPSAAVPARLRRELIEDALAMKLAGAHPDGTPFDATTLASLDRCIARQISKLSLRVVGA